MNNKEIRINLEQDINSLKRHHIERIKQYKEELKQNVDKLCELLDDEIFERYSEKDGLFNLKREYSEKVMNVEDSLAIIHSEIFLTEAQLDRDAQKTSEGVLKQLFISQLELIGKESYYMDDNEFNQTFQNFKNNISDNFNKQLESIIKSKKRP